MNSYLSRVGKIERESISFKVYQHIRQKIMSGALLPQTHLLEKHIAEQMGVSRSPVREALRLLEADGLIEFRANKGSFVRELKPEEVREIYTARRLIEGYVAGMAAKSATRKDIELLHAAMERVSEAALKEDYKNTLRADYDFHHLIWEISGHKVLYGILEQLQIQIRMFMVVQAPLFKDLFASIKDHQKIFSSIANGDVKGAQDSMEEHITEAGILTLGPPESKQEKVLSKL